MHKQIYVKEHGFMAHHAFEDVDGRTWELMRVSSPSPAA